MPARIATIAAAALVAAGAWAAAGATGTAYPQARDGRSATALRDVDRSRAVSVSIGVRHDAAGLTRRLARGQAGRAPIGEIVRRHGATGRDIAVVRRWAAAHGLRAVPGRLGTRVVVSGPAARMASALGIRLRHYRARSGRTYVAAARVIRVPHALRGVATGVAGLSHVMPPPPHSRPAARPGARAAQAPSGLPGCSTATTMDLEVPGAGYGTTPLGIARAYGFAGIGAGASYPPQTIAVVEIGQNYTPADVSQFMRDCRFGPGGGTVTPSQVNLSGAPTGISTSANGEAQLDTQWLGALAPAGTRIAVINVSPTSSTWYVDFLEQASALPNLTAISVSYSAAEITAEYYAQTSPQVPQEFQQAEPMLTALAASGVSILVATGDQGSMGPPATACPSLFPMYGAPGYASVNWLASPPPVTAVGGTMWVPGAGGVSEQAWSQPAGFGPVPWACGPAGTGGGQSLLYPRPAWQASTTTAIPGVSASGVGMPGAPVTGAGRLVPDLALLGGYPAFATLTNGAPIITEGTSGAAPVLAAAVLRVNAERLAAGRAPVGFLNPLLYGPLAGTFRDVTVGSNDIFGTGKCCTAGPGYDMASGLGAPDIAQWPALIP